MPGKICVVGEVVRREKMNICVGQWTGFSLVVITLVRCVVKNFFRAMGNRTGTIRALKDRLYH